MPLILEPAATALLLALFGVLLGVSVWMSRASQRSSVPVLLVFLAVGMLAGSEGVGRLAFNDYPFAYRLGTLALVLILFDGGLNTSVEALRRVWRPAVSLATLGVALTAGLLAIGAHALGFGWLEALLLGAIVSSTDAAAVFSVLRGSGLHLKRRVGTTLELESGLNDPMAVILTTAFTALVIAPGEIRWWEMPVDVLIQLVVGGAIGVGLGFFGRWALVRLRLPAGGLYAAFTVALAMAAYGVPTLLDGSGFLAVYLSALVLGQGSLPYHAGLARVHNALAWLSQIAMFLLLGLLVYPSRLLEVAGVGIALAFILAVVARPVAVWASLIPFPFGRGEKSFLALAGLRGAVPIILATYPVLRGAPGAERLFDTVFFIVVVSALIPGALVAWLARRLGLERPEPPRAAVALELNKRRAVSGSLLSFRLHPALPVVGATIADLPLPEGAAVALIVRGDELVPARGRVRLEAEDDVYLVVRPDDVPAIQLLFGKVMEE